MYKEEIRNKIKKFIEENGLEFNGIGSEINSDYTTVAGYIDYLNREYLGKKFWVTVKDLKNIIYGINPDAKFDEEDFKKVFDYAQKKHYGEWWKEKLAKKLYKF